MLRRTRIAGGVRRLAAVAWLLALVGCRGKAAPPASVGTLHVTDDAGRVVHVRAPVRRVLSLLPSLTETLVALGAAETLVGRTRYDTLQALRRLPDVGGGLDPSVETVLALRPQVVLGFASPHSPHASLAEVLARYGVPTLLFAIQDTADVFRSIAVIGRLVGRENEARALARRLRAAFDSVRRVVAERPRPRVAYLSGGTPPYTASNTTFLGQLLELAGGRNVFPVLERPWAPVSLEEVVRRRPEVLVLPTGSGVPDLASLRRAPGWRDLPAVRTGRVVWIDADLLHRPGPNLPRVAWALARALHPEATASAPAGR